MTRRTRRSRDWWLARYIYTEDSGDLFWTVSSIDTDGTVVLRCTGGGRTETTLDALHAAHLKGEIDVV